MHSESEVFHSLPGGSKEHPSKLQAFWVGSGVECRPPDLELGVFPLGGGASLYSPVMELLLAPFSFIGK